MNTPYLVDLTGAKYPIVCPEWTHNASNSVPNIVMVISQLAGVRSNVTAKSSLFVPLSESTVWKPRPSDLGMQDRALFEHCFKACVR